MTITFTNSTLPKHITESIIIDGNEVESVDIYAEGSADRFHAYMKIGDESVRLAQGHGGTREEAIANAFVWARRDMAEALDRLALLELALPTGFVAQHRAK